MTFDNTDIQDVELARHLRLGEITCHCCGRGAMNISLLTAWGRLRAVYAKPIVIMSAFRCPSHNKDIPGSSESSWHMQGMALDIVALDPWWFTDGALGIIMDAGFRGIGRNADMTYLHLDVRLEPYFWRYEGTGRVADKAAMKIWTMRRLRHNG